MTRRKRRRLWRRCRRNTRPCWWSTRERRISSISSRSEVASTCPRSTRMMRKRVARLRRRVRRKLLRPPPRLLKNRLPQRESTTALTRAGATDASKLVITRTRIEVHPAELPTPNSAVALTITRRRPTPPRPTSILSRLRKMPPSPNGSTVSRVLRQLSKLCRTPTSCNDPLRRPPVESTTRSAFKCANSTRRWRRSSFSCGRSEFRRKKNVTFSP